MAGERAATLAEKQARVGPIELGPGRELPTADAVTRGLELCP